MTLHDRDGMPDPDPLWVGDTDPEPLPRSGAILGYGCLALGLVLVAVVVGVVR